MTEEAFWETRVVGSKGISCSLIIACVVFQRLGV